MMKTPNTSTFGRRNRNGAYGGHACRRPEAGRRTGPTPRAPEAATLTPLLQQVLRVRLGQVQRLLNRQLADDRLRHPVAHLVGDLLEVDVIVVHVRLLGHERDALD